MCGRFAFYAPRQAVLDTFGVELPFEPAPRYNVAPSQPVVALRTAADGAIEGVQLRWGLVPFWAREPGIGNRLINARAETLGEKPAFREAFRRRRCVVLASGFYEWRRDPGGRTPCYIAPVDGRPLAFAALWEHWDRGGQPLETCALVTTAANRSLRDIHERMPVVLAPAAMRSWLAPATPVAALTALLAPAAGDLLAWHEVGRAVNSPAHDGPELVRPQTVR